MALFRDPKIVKIVAESLNIDHINDDACKHILTDVEQKLRLLIHDAIKYMKHFNRDKIRIEDINFALKDNNFFDNFFGFEINEEYEYSRLGDVWVMQNAEVDIKQQISKEITKLKKFAKPKLSFKWLSIGGVIPKTNENSFIISNNTNNIINAMEQPPISNMEIEKISEKIPKEIHILQSPNLLLSQEMQQFLNILLKTLKEEEELIDEEMAKGKYQESEKFKKMMANIRLSSALNNILPFVLNFILNDYNKILYNGYEKKLLHVKLLFGLINNSSINHEFHLHLFLKILMHFLTSNKISVNTTSTVYELRETTAKSIICLINLYEDKYKHIKFQTCEILLNIFNENHFNYQTNYGILCFFFYMDSIIIYEILLPSLVKLLESEQFQLDLSWTYKNKSQELLDINNENNNNRPNKSKKHIFDKENMRKLNEAHKTYLMILKCCCKLMIYFPYIQKSSNKEYSNLYLYFYEMMGEVMIPYAIKIFTYNRDLSSKLINLYKSQFGHPANLADSFNPLELNL